MKTIFFVFFLLITTSSYAQFRLKSIGPKEIQEGQKVSFQALFEEKRDSLLVKWQLSSNSLSAMEISSAGVFSWIPDYKIASSQEPSKTIELYIKAFAQQDSLIFQDSTLVTFIIKNANTPPIVPKEIETVWVAKANTEVSKVFAKEYYRDEENDALAFRLINEKYPTIKLSPDGILTISLTNKELKKLPDTLTFEVSELETNEKYTVKQKIILKKSEIDEAPTISISPDSPKFQLEEGDELKLLIRAEDENDDIKEFDIYTIPQSKFLPKEFLEKQPNGNYIFRWTPPLDFVANEQPNKAFQLVISVKDEAKLLTTKQLEIDIINKIDWEIEDPLREKEYYSLVRNATETYLRLDKTFQGMDKDIRKLMKNKGFKNVAAKSLSLLSNNLGLIKNEDTKAQVGSYTNIASGVAEIGSSTTNAEKEFPEEFSKLNRFSKIVTYLKDTFVNTEQFIEKYKNPINRRNTLFFTEKMELQKYHSLILKDNLLNLETLKKPITDEDLKRVFTNYE